MIGQWVKIKTQDKNHIPWNKNRIPPPRTLRGFSRQSYRSLTGKCQRQSERIICIWCLNIRDNVLMDLKYACQQYFTYMCVLGFVRYYKIVIACGYRKYENLFTHEYHIHLGHCPWGIWYAWVNQFSYFPHQHAMNVLYEITDIRIAFTFTANQYDHILK